MPDVAALLHELTRGTDDPDVVAEELRKRGVTGVRDDAFYGPVSKYLQSHGFPWGCAETRCGPLGASVFVPLPGGVARFLNIFDAGDYPDLEADDA